MATLYMRYANQSELFAPKGGGKEDYEGEDFATAGEHHQAHEPFAGSGHKVEGAGGSGDPVAKSVVTAA